MSCHVDVKKCWTNAACNYVGLVHQHQLLLVEFVQAENQLLKERLRGKRVRFTDAERALLARKARTGRGLVTHYLLFVINLADRAVKIPGIARRPDEASVEQVGRNLTDWQAGALHSMRSLIIDRDTKYSAQFRRLIRLLMPRFIVIQRRAIIYS
jgi:hypothetical protein